MYPNCWCWEILTLVWHNGIYLWHISQLKYFLRKTPLNERRGSKGEDRLVLHSSSSIKIIIWIKLRYTVFGWQRCKKNYLLQQQLSYLHVNSMICLGNNDKTSKKQTLVASSDRGKNSTTNYFIALTAHFSDNGIEREKAFTRKKSYQISNGKVDRIKTLSIRHIYKITYLYR